MYVGDAHQANISMDVYEGLKGPSFVRDISDNTTIGFKYFDLKGIKGLKITTRGYGKGEFEIRTSPDGDVLGTIGVEFCTVWETNQAEFTLPDGVYPLFLTFKGGGSTSLLSFEFLH